MNTTQTYIDSLEAQNRALREKNNELIGTLKFILFDLNSEIDLEARLIIESVLSKTGGK